MLFTRAAMNASRYMRRRWTSLRATIGETANCQKSSLEYSTLVRTITELAIARKRDQQPQYAQWVLAQQLSGMQVGAAPELQLFAGGNR